MDIPENFVFHQRNVLRNEIIKCQPIEVQALSMTEINSVQKNQKHSESNPDFRESGAWKKTQVFCGHWHWRTFFPGFHSAKSRRQPGATNRILAWNDATTDMSNGCMVCIFPKRRDGSTEDRQTSEAIAAFGTPAPDSRSDAIRPAAIDGRSCCQNVTRLLLPCSSDLDQAGTCGFSFSIMIEKMIEFRENDKTLSKVNLESSDNQYIGKIQKVQATC